MIFAHRLFYTAHKGEIPTGLLVCHRCDTPACVNPDHLFLGTIAENNHDRTLKGRCRGTWNGRAVLTPDDVRAIRASSEGTKAIAGRYGVARTTVYDIRHGRTWSEVA